MEWIHTYTPLGSVWWSALAAAVPFVLLCWQLLIRRAKGHIAALTALCGAAVLALTVWGMPLSTMLSAGIYGIFFALFPILWIILTAMWFYTMNCEAGQFAIVRESIGSLSQDRRIQAIFIAFAFGALLESTAGYGAPVAIGAAMLIGLGFPPVLAASLCLIANTVPVAYAGMGLPALVAGQVADMDPFVISQLIGRQLPLLALLVPLWLSVLVCGWRRSCEVWPVLLAAGFGSAIPTWLFATFHGYTLPGIMGALGSLLAIVLLLRYWQPRTLFRFASDPQLPVVHAQARHSVRGHRAKHTTDRTASHTSGLATGHRDVPTAVPTVGFAADNSALQAASQFTGRPADCGGTHTSSFTAAQIRRAWLPWLVLTLCVITTSLGPVRSLLNGFFAPVIPWPGLHLMVSKAAPLASGSDPLPALFVCNIFSSPGTAILFAGLLAPLLMPKYSWKQALGASGRICYQMRWSMLTIVCILALAQIMNYSGMSYTLGLALTHTGVFFPLFAPILGWLGVFLTGSDTSSNALFCGMQRTTAEAVGMDPILAVAANTTGGVTAKMVSPQSIAVAVGATGMSGQEGTLMRATAAHSLLMLAMVCALTWLQN